MAVKKDTLQTTLLMDGKQAINQLGKLEMQYADIRRSLKGMKKDHKDYERLAGNQKKIQAEIDKTRAALGIQGMTLTQLIRYEKDLQRTRSNTTTRGTAEYKRLTAEIQQASAAIRTQRMEARGMTSVWSKLSKEVKQFGMIALGYLGFTAITGQINNLIRRSGELSDSLASVRKTTGLTADEMEFLNKQLGKIDTRTARKELLSMAKVAGKLGITGARDVEGFVRAFDKINVALGEDLGNPEEVARKLGKIMEAFGTNKIYGIEEGLLKVGSAVNHLGKSSTANEGYIVEFTRRMAGIAPLANLSLQNVMGLGATLDALGQTSEVSSTSLNKLFIKMTQNSELFAKYAKDANGAQMSSKQFAQLIETDFNEAFISLLRGVKDNSAGMTALSDTLGDLELDGGRVIGVLGTLANNTELLAQQQKISNDEFQKGTSVINEFNLMNETLGAKLDKLQKAIYRAFVNSAVVDGISNIVDALYSWIEVPISEQLADEQAELNALVRSLISVNDNERLRVALISEIQTKYPGFLKNMDTEKLNATQLHQELAKVNDQYYKKIILQSAEEELADYMKSQVDLMRQRIQLEKEQDAYNQKVKDDPSYGFDSFTNPTDEIRDIDNELAALDKQIEEKTAEFQELLSGFGQITLPSLGSGGLTFEETPVSNEPTAIDQVLGTKPENENKTKEYLQTLEDAFTQERTALKQQRALGLISEDEYNLQLEELELAHLHVMLGLRKELGLSTIDISEKIFDKELDIQDRRTKAAENADKKIADSDKKLQEERKKNLELFGSSLAQAFGALSSLQKENTEEGIKNAANLANAQVVASNISVVADQAAALGAAIKAGTNAGAAMGPAAPLAIPAYIAALMGTVLSAFASIRSNNRSADQSITSLRETNSKKESSGRSYYHGGETGYDSIGKGDVYGPFTGYTHAGELVVPNYIRSEPKVIDAEKVIKARMAGYSLGGSTNVNSTATLDADRFDAAVSRFEAIVTVLIKNGIPSYFTPRELEKGNENANQKTNARSRGALS